MLGRFASALRMFIMFEFRPKCFQSWNLIPFVVKWTSLFKSLCGWEDPENLHANKFYTDFNKPFWSKMEGNKMTAVHIIFL
jgi:hypothetical protein